MFIRAGNRLINTDNVVEIYVRPPGEARPGRSADPHPGILSLDIVTTAPEGDVMNEDGTGSVHPYEIRLRGEEAEAFLRVLYNNRLVANPGEGVERG